MWRNNSDNTSVQILHIYRVYYCCEGETIDFFIILEKEQRVISISLRIYFI